MASPHRFLAKKGQPQTGGRSSLRHETRQPEGEEPTSTSSSQFAHAPRFSHGRSKTNNDLKGATSPPHREGFLQALKGAKATLEKVDDAASEDEELLDNGQAVLIFPTDEVHPPGEGEQQQWAIDLPMSPKRRKIAEPSTSPYITNHGLRSSPFHPASTSSMNVIDTAFPRPAFVRPTSHQDEPREPVPEIFSPHRRGVKFVAGGIAATAQQWVLETGQAAVQSRKGMGYLQGEVFAIRATIEREVKGNGPFTTVVRCASGEIVRILLTSGGNGATATRRDHLGLGTTIGVRAPTWDVEMDGEMWTIAVDWRILNSPSAHQ